MSLEEFKDCINKIQEECRQEIRVAHERRTQALADLLQSYTLSLAAEAINDTDGGGATDGEGS